MILSSNKIVLKREKMERRVYLDNAATTFVSKEVLNEMLPCFNIKFGNPNSLHSFGREAMAVVDTARDKVAKAINAKSVSEIYFTSGGTEADNWAIKGIAHAYANKGKHIITSSIEHHAILDSCKQLEREGFDVTYLPVDKYGLVDLTDVMRAIRPDTILISVMTVNNEVGTVQNIKAIAKIAHEKGIVFHTDAVQAVGAVKLDVQDMEIDAMSMSAHKIYGPKGCGALYLKSGIRIDNLLNGGAQERAKRGGTSNVPAIAGFGKAIEIATRDLEENQKKIKTLRDYFEKEIKSKIAHIHINGHPTQKIDGTLSVTFELIEGESILMSLDLEGIAVSTASACTSLSLQPSHVLRAMGIPDEIAHGTIRFSFGKNLTKEDIDYTIEKLVGIVKKLRAISPLTLKGEE